MMEAEFEETASHHEETRAKESPGGSGRDSRALLRSTAQHLASLLETTEAQLEILTTELLPPRKENPIPHETSNDIAATDARHTRNSGAVRDEGNASFLTSAESVPGSLTTCSNDLTCSQSDPKLPTEQVMSDATCSSGAPFTPVATPPSASPATLASSILRNRGARSSGNFLETNVLLARQYHQDCCALSKILHEEIERLELVREGVSGNRIYNAVLQVENLRMLKEETKNLALLRKALSEN